MKMKTDCYLKPAWTHNGSIRTDMPLTVVTWTDKRKCAEELRPGQLFCVGKVYVKTHSGLVRIR